MWGSANDIKRKGLAGGRGAWKGWRASFMAHYSAVVLHCKRLVLIGIGRFSTVAGRLAKVAPPQHNGAGGNKANSVCHRTG